MTKATGRAKAARRSPRVLEVLALAENEPTVADLRGYLSDVDSEVRRIAVTTLTEVAPDGVGIALAEALADPHSAVRAAAADGLRELVEVIPPSDALRGLLLGAPADVRGPVLEVLRVLRLGDAAVFTAGLGDRLPTVRIEALRGLVSLNETGLIAAAATDSAREVRVAVATGLGIVADPAGVPVLAELAGDVDAVVRASALAAAARIGAPAPLHRPAADAVDDTAWQVREASAKALGPAPWEIAGKPLLRALADTNSDVRRAAVQSLSRWATEPEVAAELTAALADPDADVRAWARKT